MGRKLFVFVSILFFFCNFFKLLVLDLDFLPALLMDNANLLFN